MRLFVLAIATLVVLHGYVESKNATSPTKSSHPTTTTTVKQTTTKSATTAAATTKKPDDKQPGSDREARGKRTLEFGNFGNYNYYQSVPAAHTAQRRVSHAYQDPGQYNHYQSNYIQPQFAYQHHSSPSGPAGAPAGSYQAFDGDSSNSIGNFQSLPQAVHTHYIEPPEPIIEIIIKESNDSLPLDTQTILPRQKKKKEEVQVFYVKYHKDETNGQLVLDDPLPAIKPIPDESEEEEDLSQEPIVVTPSPPLKTTTLRAIINPDSEKYHSNSGIRISFGTEDKHQAGHQLSESESESVAQPIVALPQHNTDHRSKSDVFYQQHQQFVQQHNDRAVRQQYPHQPQSPQQPLPQQPHHHHQYSVPVQQQAPQPQQPQQPHQQYQAHQYQQAHPAHHQQLPQAQPLVQQHQEQANFGQRFAPATPQPYRAQPPPPPPPPPQSQPQPQPQHQQFQQQQQQQQQHHHQQHQHYQQHYQHQPPAQPQPQPQAPRVVYNQAQPQPQPQYQFRQQFTPQQQPQPQYFTQQAPVPQPRPQQVRFPPAPAPSPQQQQQNYYQPQPQPPQQPPHQPQFQRQEFQQPKPIPIPLHNINQQPPLRQQYSSPPPQPQHQQVPPQPQFNQPFNNFYKQQPQSVPQPQAQPQFRKPVPPQPSSLQQPPFLSARPQSPAQQAPAFHNERPAYFDVPRPVQGGLVQQAAPNLGPTRAPERPKGVPQSSLTDNEHLANLKHVLPAGGELVASVSKYEKHITETVNGPAAGQRLTASSALNDPLNRPPYYNILPSQELISHSIEPTLETIGGKNIGPLASNIGPLPTPQKYVSQQAAQVIPNSEPLNFGVNPRFNTNFEGGASTAQGLGSTPSTVGTTRTTYSPTFSTTPRTTVGRYTAPPTTTTYRTTRPPTTVTTTTTPRSAAESTAANEKKQKALFDLPDEVPDDLREQLLSSGILENADISVLDYDKIGETALENLPPEHLANFFNAGGGSQLAGSNNVLSVVKPNGDKLAEKFITKNYDVKDKQQDRDRYEIAKSNEGDSEAVQLPEADQPTIVTMPERQNVDLKVVRFDSNNQRNVTDRYIKQDSTILPSVDVTSEDQSDQNDQVFNRYLPLKINGAQFPIPDVVELRGRKIASVVVLAPVDGEPTNVPKSGESSASEEGASNGGFLINAEDDSATTDEQKDQQQQSRFERDVLLDSKKIKFIAGEALKQLIKKPSRENFRRWLDREGKTDVDLQSVVLLVTRNENDEQEIFMYDIATKGVTHLSGELSAAFVQVAEENAKTQNFDEVPIVDSGIVEQMETKSSESSLDYGGDSSFALTSSEEQDEQAQASERKAFYVYPENYRGLEVNSGYSNIKK